MCLLGRFLSCTVAVGSTGGILKSECRYFLGRAASTVFKVGEAGTSGSTGSVS